MATPRLARILQVSHHLGMSKRIPLLFALSFAVSALSFAEAPPLKDGELLRPKRKETTTPRVNRQPLPEVAPQGSQLVPRRQERVQRPAAPQRVQPQPQEEYIESAPTSLSILLLTPLIKNDIYDARFSTFGLEILSSMPLFRLTDYVPFFLEFGPGLTYSRLSLSQPALTFTHMYFFLPLRLRTQLVLGSSNVRLDLMAGIQFRPFEYDSRDTLDGGFNSTGSFFGSIDPDLSVGLVVPIGESYRFRAYAGYLKLSMGLEALL